MPFGNRKKNILEALFSSVFFFFQFRKYRPTGYLKLNNLGIFQSWKFRILMEKSLPISLKLNFTPNILGCYGLRGPCSPMNKCRLLEWKSCFLPSGMRVAKTRRKIVRLLSPIARLHIGPSSLRCVSIQQAWLSKTTNPSRSAAPRRLPSPRKPATACLCRTYIHKEARTVSLQANLPGLFPRWRKFNAFVDTNTFVNSLTSRKLRRAY